MLIIKTVTSIIIALIAVLGISAPTDYDAPIDNYNGGDPYIVEDETGTYYTYTTGGGVDILKIESFDKIEVTEKKTVYYLGNDGLIKDIWAPEIHKIGDRWYIIACGVFDPSVADRGTMPCSKEDKEHDDYYRYGFVLESKTEDIFGEYEFKGILAPDGMNNIDGTYLHKDGKLYYVCSAYMDVGHQCIYICEMENPYTLKTDETGKNNAVKLSAPILYWERKGWKVNEGPAVLYKDDDIYIVYSASGFSSGGYCLGMLTLRGCDVMNPWHWTKSPSRVLYHQPMKDIYNAGHCSFLYRDNGDIFMVYHATATRKFEDSPRLTYIKEVDFVLGRPTFI